MRLEQRAEIDKWLEVQNQGILEAENAMRKVRFAEQMVDRLLGEAGVELEPAMPYLYLVPDL